MFLSPVNLHAFQVQRRQSLRIKCGNNEATLTIDTNKSTSHFLPVAVCWKAIAETPGGDDNVQGGVVAGVGRPREGQDGDQHLPRLLQGAHRRHGRDTRAGSTELVSASSTTRIPSTSNTRPLSIMHYKCKTNYAVKVRIPFLYLYTT